MAPMSAQLDRTIETHLHKNKVFGDYIAVEETKKLQTYLQTLLSEEDKTLNDHLRALRTYLQDELGYLKGVGKGVDTEAVRESLNALLDIIVFFENIISN